MAEINKINVGGVSYDIVPRLGTGLTNKDGDITVSIGSGIAIDEKKGISLNLGACLSYDAQGKLQFAVDTAVVDKLPGVDCGIATNGNGLLMDSEKFKNFLKSLGVVFNQ